MTKNILLLFLFSFIACSVPHAGAQLSFGGLNNRVASEPVRWEAKIENVKNGHATVVLTAAIEKGWHLYGTSLPSGGPKPTAFDFSESNDVETGTPKASCEPKKVNDPLFDMELSWWDADVSFVVPVTLVGPAPEFTCKISFMTCDGNSCMPPKTITLNLPIKQTTH